MRCRFPAISTIYSFRTKAESAFINSYWRDPRGWAIFPRKSKADKLKKLSDI
jgi:hypothetical protein